MRASSHIVELSYTVVIVSSIIEQHYTRSCKHAVAEIFVSVFTIEVRTESRESILTFIISSAKGTVIESDSLALL